MSKKHSYVEMTNLIGATGLEQCKCSICGKLLVGAFRADVVGVVPRCGAHAESEPKEIERKVIIPMDSDTETN